MSVGDIMLILKNKHVLHIPLSRFVNGELEMLDIDDLLEELFRKLEENSIEGFYITRATGFYRFRSYPELLITVYSNEKGTVEEIFEEWFQTHNKVLCQEAFSYEANDRLHVIRLDDS
jgi:hypothetical protein